jgi:hypothetical protein
MNIIEIIRNRKPTDLNYKKKCLEIHSQLIQAGRLLGAKVSNKSFNLPDGRSYAFELNHYRIELIPLWTNNCHFLNPTIWHGDAPEWIKDRIIEHLATITKINRKTL